MNLLPHWVIRKQQRYALIKRMVAAEAIIFFIFIGAVLSAERMVRTARAESNRLEEALLDSRYAESDAVAESLKIINAQRDEYRQWEAALDPVRFDTRLLEAAYHTLPDGARLQSVVWENETLTLTVAAENLKWMEMHRKALSETALFAQVSIASVTRLDDVWVQYILLAKADRDAK